MSNSDKYYEKDGIKLMLGDSLEAMKSMPDNSFDIAIVDPPYGGNDAINLENNTGNKKQAALRKNYKSFENKHPKKTYFDELFRISKNQIIWGVNFYPFDFLTGGRLVWDKKGTAFGRAELAYVSMTKSVNIVELAWNGMIQHDMKNKEVRIHPTQKPVALYEWLLKNYTNDGDTILDTHLGSGSIAIACHKMKRQLVGYEIDEDYFNAACKRFDEQTRQQTLW